MSKSTTVENLNVVATNVRANLVQVNVALEQAKTACENVDPEAREAFHLLMRKYEHGQAVAAQLQSFEQVIQLTKTKGEMEALVAAVEVASGDSLVLEAVEKGARRLESEASFAASAQAAQVVGQEVQPQG